MKTRLLTLCVATIFLITGCENPPYLSDTEFNTTYSGEVCTGIEYQIASHLMMHGEVDEFILAPKPE